MNVVLAPGILGFSRIGPVSYFADVAERLRQRLPGIAVLEVDTHPLGSIEFRANKLADQIRSALGNGALRSGEPIDICGHSIGGLDGRYLISRINDVGSKVRTLACIATPHLGTSLAGLIPSADSPSLLGDLLTNSFGVLKELRGHTNAVKELTPAALDAFNARHPDRAGVRYINVVGVGRGHGLPTSVLFVPTHALLSTLEGSNDGVVSVASASAGKPPHEKWQGDHADLIGHNLDAPVGANNSAFDHLQYYEKLVRTFE